MANQISKEKQRLNLVLEKKLVGMIDLEAKTKGVTRTAVIVSAIREHFNKSDDTEIIKAKLDALEAQQAATATMLVEAIKNQPIAIQEAPQAALPAPEEEQYEKTWFGLYRKKKG